MEETMREKMQLLKKAFLTFGESIKRTCEVANRFNHNLKIMGQVSARSNPKKKLDK